MIQAIGIGIMWTIAFLVCFLILSALVKPKPTDKLREDEEQMQYLLHWNKD